MDALGEGIPLTRAELGARLGSSGMTLVLLATRTWAPGAEALAAFYDRRLDLTIEA